MANFSCLFFTIFFFFIFMNSSLARNLGNPTSNHHHHHQKHHKISFYMQDLLNISQPSTPKITSTTTQLPFSKPVGLFPPIKGIPIPEYNPKLPGSGSGSGSTTQTLDVPNLGLYFPTRVTLQELEFGDVVTIDGTLFDGSGSVSGSPFGKAQGVYVASSEDDERSDHMMAMTAVFAEGEFKDGLRFFGLHKRNATESHIAVIGGVGKYVDANGYATVKVADLRSNYDVVVNQGVTNLLFFNVYLSN